MANNHRQRVNPLRPYYVPPTIGESNFESSNIPGPNAFSRSANGSAKYASKARDMFSDLDYKDYISEPSPSVVGNIKEVINELMWKYTTVFLAQPFDAAKLILQVRTQDDVGSRASMQLHMAKYLSDSEGDEPAYFTSTVPHTPSPARTRRRRSITPPPETPKTAKKSTLPPHMLNIRRPDSITEVMSQLWQNEGAWGVCKGTNATFVYKVLQSLLEAWSRSLLCALLDVPDLGLKTDMDRLVDIASPYPWASLCVAAAAAVITGLILSPLDLVRTRSIITSTSRGPRRTLGILRSLPSYMCSSSLVLPTALHSFIQPILRLSTPLVLRTKFMIDSEVSPTTFSLAKFCSSTVALFVSLPLETVLRRGQVAVLSSPEYVRAIEGGGSSAKSGRSGGEMGTATTSLETIVPPGKYDGIFGTMYTIVNEEGSRAVPSTPAARTRAASKKGKPRVAETVFRRGQGVEGLWRGWKVNWWGLVGLWAAANVGGGGDGEF
ncbi:hypothetical protein M406DRAFT_97072 [Cryphonectria parasitica EP155]|uniref:Mitochondrial carrier n=1 Tax=Cryphonectria parasitica (strain ATCC 38755 / EP155) TaxID=660469 RepID=A0A9P4YDQ4_CRYP1|nr:uncharacterized protein M406DRAFT_97072 [Cryphonectria parasitica EP155]KAF3771143.1 hypothetical protein M406DRAFT_97072 [Cryphonectria parasitica EP155]